MADQKKQDPNQIPAMLGQYLPWSRVYDKLGLKSAEKDVAAHLIDRFRCSLWTSAYRDEFGVYTLYPNEDLVADVGCCDKSVAKAKQKLAECGIIVMERQVDRNAPNRVYIDLSRLEGLCKAHGTALKNSPGKGKNCDGHQIPVELGQFMVCPRVFDRLGLDSAEKDIAVHLLDRYRLSMVRARYRDENEAAYVVYGNEQLCEDIGCCLPKIKAAKEKLKKLDIIREQQVNKGAAKRIYVDLQKIYALCAQYGTTVGSGVRLGRTGAEKTATSGGKILPPSKNRNKNNTTSSLTELQEFLEQWGLTAPKTVDERKVEAALWMLLQAETEVAANSRTYSAEMQRLAAEWAQEEDVAEVLCVLRKRSADKTVPYVRAVLLAHMDELHSGEMQLRLRKRQRESAWDLADA